MTGVTSALITGGAALAGTGASILSSSAQGARQDAAIGTANQNSAAQRALQEQMLRQQMKLSTAGQTDARGNQLMYDPSSNTWVSMLSPQGQALLNRSDAVQRQFDVQNLGTGANERSSAMNRRLSEGETAQPLLDAIKYGYGAPTKEGVVGADKVAAVTNATEGADQARSGFNAAALRTGTGVVPLESTIASIDRGATQGVRSALANSEAAGGPLYTKMLSDFQNSKLGPYNTLATRASNVDNIPFSPSDVPATQDNALLNRAVRAPAGASNPYASAGTNTATNALLGAMAARAGTSFPTGAFGALGESAKNIYQSFQGQQPSPAAAFASGTVGSRPITQEQYNNGF